MRGGLQNIWSLQRYLRIGAVVTQLSICGAHLRDYLRDRATMLFAPGGGLVRMGVGGESSIHGVAGKMGMGHKPLSTAFQRDLPGSFGTGGTRRLEILDGIWRLVGIFRANQSFIAGISSFFAGLAGVPLEESVAQLHAIGDSGSDRMPGSDVTVDDPQ